MMSSSATADSPVRNGICKRRGAFVVFEGLDKSGKTTQSKLLVDSLKQKNIPATLLKFPNRDGPIGGLIDKYLRGETEFSDQSVHLLFSADRWEAKRNILDLVSRGFTVISDRYAYSGIVFSAAKGLDFDWCLSSDVGLPAPDLVLFFDVNAETAISRQGFGAERYEREQFQNKVRLQYGKLMEREKKLGREWAVSEQVDDDPSSLYTSYDDTEEQEQQNRQIVNANKPMDEVQDEVMRLVQPLLQGLDSADLSTLT